MKNQSVMLLADAYKLHHRQQYPKGTEFVFSTWTPRQSLIDGITKVVSAGQQKMIKEFLLDEFNTNFFNKPKHEIINEYVRVMNHAFFDKNPETKHIEELHDLGYLPLAIKSLPEGTLVPIRVPMMTIENTNPKFFWLTNFLETLISAELWQTATSATVAHEYRKILTDAAKRTGGNIDFVDFQGHDFSMRGMSSIASSINSGLGHLMSFKGTDTIPSIIAAETYYNADIEKELVGTSVFASEHSVMSANGMDEKSTFLRLLTEVHPTGILSIVSDTWDFWNVVGNILPQIKDTIMNREGKLVIRPDSGDPVKILTGDNDSNNEFAKKGLIQTLWDIFGGTVNSKGFKELDTHIGAIYGDSITIKRTKEIVNNLEKQGFASTNVVLGIGSFTYQYNTRDTFGFAMKATSVTINGDERQIFKAPKTDSGVKKSQKGRVAVLEINGELTVKDGLTKNEYIANDKMELIFKDGVLLRQTTLAEIRARLDNSL